MHIRFPKESLLKAVTALQKVSMNRNNSNLPGVIYITTKENHVEFQGNDYELGIKFTVEAEIIEPGTVIVVSKYFNELVRKMNSQFIELIQNEGSSLLTIRSGLSDFDLMTYPSNKFTLVDSIHDTNHILVDSNDLKNLIESTIYACSTEEDRPVFTGDLFILTEDSITMVGTDTHRMAIMKVGVENPEKQAARCIISKKTLEEVARLLPTDAPIMVKMIWNHQQIAFVFENIFLIARLIEGEYPDFTRVIPSQFDSSATLDRKTIQGAVERVSLLAKDISYNVIKYEWSENFVTLTSENSDVGAGKDVVNCEFKGEPFTIAFNGKYVSDILKHSISDEVHFYMKNGGALVIRQDDMPNYTYLVTPVRT